MSYPLLPQLVTDVTDVDGWTHLISHGPRGVARPEHFRVTACRAQCYAPHDEKRWAPGARLF